MAKVAHLVLSAYYKEGMGYQENILPKKHKQLGYDVEIVTYRRNWDENREAPRTYTNVYGIPVHILLDRKRTIWDKLYGIRPFYIQLHDESIGLYQKLQEINPDIIFLHGILCHDNYQVLRYVKEHPQIRFYVDNHCDYYNAPINTWRTRLISRVYGGKMGKALNPYAKKFWGVTPWRIQYMQDIYKVRPEKSGLLVMGGDDDYININNRANIRKTIREKYNIPEDCFLIISGGKMNAAKNSHLLAQAVSKVAHNKNVKLLLFGKFERDMIGNPAFDSPDVINLGWIKSTDCYDLFLASDLAMFPGTHSVLWEQSCACGLPGVYKDWDSGFRHIDLGGNAILLKEISVDSIADTIEELYFTAKFYEMQKVALVKGPKTFMYMEIAKRAIEYDKFEGKK